MATKVTNTCFSFGWGFVLLNETIHNPLDCTALALDTIISRSFRSAWGRLGLARLPSHLKWPADMALHRSLMLE